MPRPGTASPERLVDAVRSESQAYVTVLIGGEAGMRCGEVGALVALAEDATHRHLR